MPFGGFGDFNPKGKATFDSDFAKGIDTLVSKKLTRSDAEPVTGRGIKFYNTDSLWSRWRKGYELYTLIQSTLGSTAAERKRRGDYRLYFTFQQFPGVFIPARVYTFPSTNQELGEQIVGMRDTDAFSFYDYGLPILGVRYLGKLVSATYSQSGTTLVVTKQDHGLYPGESVWLDISTGGGVDETLSIVSTTQNTFTVTTSASGTNNGNVNYYLSTTFGDSRWTTTRVRLRYLPTELSFFSGERLADRIIEKDPGLASTYSRSGTTVTITCPSAHGLSSGNKVFIDVTSGNVASGRYTVTVTSSTQFTVGTLLSGTTSGNVTVSRLLRGRDYKNYVGYTVSGLDAATKEIIFQRADSYGATTTNEVTSTVVPAHRGFTIGRYLTTELRWHCSCQDFSRRDSYDLKSDLRSERFPRTTPKSLKPGEVLLPDGTLSNERDIPGTFRDLGYTVVNNFYQLPRYEDEAVDDVQSLMYYQMRWCKHIYAAMFAITHDEGNDPIDLAAKYVQSGPNITINIDNHGLEANTKVELAFTSGNAISGEYNISSVPDPNSFTVIYPFSDTASGYCTVSNLKKHDYVRSWLLEPSDKPVGEGLERFEKRFSKEKEKLESNFELLKLTQQNTPWSGGKTVIGNRNLPQSVADFDPSLIGMTLTDSLRRDPVGNLDRAGKSVNTTNRMITLINKLFNRSPVLIEDVKLGIVDKPIDEFATDYESGVIDAGEFINGEPTENVASNSTIDSSTYSPITDQDVVVDSDLYINS
jgi:hypothetical protein